MSKWQFIKQRILFGEKKQVQGKNGKIKTITAYTDPQTGDVINTWGIQVVEKCYITPGGAEHKQIITIGEGLCSVMVFALSHDLNVILVKQYRHGMDIETIECPAGLMLGEQITYKELAIREVLEETGYGEQEQMTQLAPPLYTSTGKADTYFIPFLATGLRKISEQNLDSSEDIQVITIPIADWLKMIKEGQVIGACSLATTLLALLKLKGDGIIQ